MFNADAVPYRPSSENKLSNSSGKKKITIIDPKTGQEPDFSKSVSPVKQRSESFSYFSTENSGGQDISSTDQVENPAVIKAPPPGFEKKSLVVEESKPDSTPKKEASTQINHVDERKLVDRVRQILFEKGVLKTSTAFVAFNDSEDSDTTEVGLDKSEFVCRLRKYPDQFLFSHNGNKMELVTLAKCKVLRFVVGQLAKKLCNSLTAETAFELYTNSMSHQDSLIHLGSPFSSCEFEKTVQSRPDLVDTSSTSNWTLARTIVLCVQELTRKLMVESPNGFLDTCTAFDHFQQMASIDDDVKFVVARPVFEQLLNSKSSLFKLVDNNATVLANHPSELSQSVDIAKKFPNGNFDTCHDFVIEFNVVTDELKKSQLIPARPLPPPTSHPVSSIAASVGSFEALVSSVDECLSRVWLTFPNDAVCGKYSTASDIAKDFLFRMYCGDAIDTKQNQSPTPWLCKNQFVVYKSCDDSVYGRGFVISCGAESATVIDIDSGKVHQHLPYQVGFFLFCLIIFSLVAIAFLPCPFFCFFFLFRIWHLWIVSVTLTVCPFVVHFNWKLVL